MLEIVGNHLVNQALKETTATRIDAYGRSAFNRYYYSAFLVSRKMIFQIDRSRTKLDHDKIPGILRGPIINKIKNDVKRLKGKDPHGHKYRSVLLSSVRRSAGQLADLMAEAYAVRCIADYNPEEIAYIDGSSLRLSNCSVSRAQHWSSNAELYARSIISVYDELGLI